MINYYYSSPIQVPGTTWNDLDMGDTDEFIKNMNEEIRKDEGDIELNNIKGGSDSLVNVDDARSKRECGLIKDTKNIYLYQIPFINKC